jgi:hypothetical protein
VRFPTLEEAIACNEAVREPNESSPSADDDDLARVGQALRRAQPSTDAIEAAASLAYEITFAKASTRETSELPCCWPVG